MVEFVARLSSEQLLGRFIEGAELRAFRQQALRIKRGHKRRLEMQQRREYMPPWKTPAGYLQRETYRLTRLLDGSGRAWVIEAIVRERGKEPRAPTYLQNKFYWGLLAIEGHSPLLSPQRRRLFAANLKFADMNLVPEVHLIGFVYQLGSEKTIFQRLARRRLHKLFRLPV
ncbi:MAG: hypothetical protein EOP50_10545 [Sphingobacteriales bacterium]|nr:MAG: hypothetical protein EOP50_10545 [Sphingobacteriales bacterium]